MMNRMKRQWLKREWLGWCSRWVAIVVLALAPATALARSEDADPDIVDARLEGYAANYTLPAGGSGLTWFIFVILSVVACVGLFKDAKRTHLD